MEDLKHKLAKIEEKIKGKVVAFQLPNGLRHRLCEVFNTLEKAGSTPIFVGESCYGACDVPAYAAKIGADILLHIGHEHIRSEREVELPVIYIGLEARIRIQAVADQIIKNCNTADLTLTAPYQYAKELPKIASILREHGFRAQIKNSGRGIKTPGVVLGCNFEAGKAKTGTVVFVGDGEFHPRGLALATERAVMAVHPSGSQAVWVRSEEYLKQRYSLMGSLLDAKSVGIILSLLPGQCRRRLARSMFLAAKNSGKNAALIAVEHVSPSMLQGLGFDFYVSTACPRIALDDWKNYEAPIITPPEFMCILQGITRTKYAVDEIR